MASRKQEGEIFREFKRRRTRQLTAIALALFSLLSLAWKLNHPGLLLGELSRTTVTALEIIFIAAFALFSGLNWRCPACNRYLGRDINPPGCRKCGARLR